VKISGLRTDVVRLAIATLILTSTFATQVRAQALPSGWASTDIGTTTVPGSTQYAGGTFTLAGAGNIGGTADAFRFVYRQVTGDVTILARVVSVQGVRPSSKAGVMVRESLNPDAAMGLMFISAASGSAFDQRVATGRNSTTGKTVAPPYWVRLERRGTTMTASQSSNGTTWVTVGQMTLNASTVCVGLAVASADPSQSATSVFDNVLVNAANQPPANLPPTVSLTAPANGATFTTPATVTITATASDTDGTVATVEFYAGSSLIGSDSTSPYGVTWNNAPAGTYALSAVARDNTGATTTSAARSITVTGANQLPTVSLTGPANGATFTAPATIQLSAVASDADGTVTGVDFYAGSTLIGSDPTNPYSVTWSNVSAGTYPLTAVARDNVGATRTSAPSTVTVTASGGLPTGWTAADIGATPLPGSTQYSNGTFTAAGAGEVGSTADSFHFAYRQGTGDVSIRARVMSIQNLQPWSKAGVMIRESLAANSAFGMMFVSAGAGSAFYKRLTTDAARTSTTGSAVVTPYWVRIERRGSVVTASQSTDGVTWDAIDTMTLSAPTMYVGLAVASATSTLATGVFDNVTVESPSVNQPPAVSLTSPANGAAFTAPASIALAATASDTDGTVAGVDFYAGATLLGTDTSSPYTFNWSAVAAGSYALSARARDNTGATTTSAVHTVTVSAAPTNVAPTVSLTTPAAGAVFTAPATVAIAATASDPDGSVVQVDFYAGAVLIGSDTTSPYSMSWGGVAAGTYALTAVARDNAGAMTVSAARDIRVDSATLPRTAIFTASTNHDTAVDRYFLEIFPVGANPAVANPVATRDLGKPAVVNGEIQLDISSTTTALPSGSYIATVTAIGNGGSARSAASPAFTR
jgi:regulation of enolase protein 1 (concanavalin A-like superfamily)